MVVQRLDYFRIFLTVRFEMALNGDHSCLKILQIKTISMRFLNLLLPFSALVFFNCCSGQSNSAVEDQKKAYDALAKAAPRGEAPSAAIFLEATVNGKPWTATRVFREPDARSSYCLVSGENNGITIGFNVYHAHMKEGDIKDFGANLCYLLDAEKSYDGGRAGKVTITKVDDNGFEGSFYFTASSTDQPEVYKVTSGSFRSPWPGKK
jgi:Family of unknown function (DUF6252)